MRLISLVVQLRYRPPDVFFAGIDFAGCQIRHNKPDDAIHAAVHAGADRLPASAVTGMIAGAFHGFRYSTKQKSPDCSGLTGTELTLSMVAILRPLFYGRVTLYLATATPRPNVVSVTVPSTPRTLPEFVEFQSVAPMTPVFPCRTTEPPASDATMNACVRLVDAESIGL